jgi:hypothetical protein
MIRALDEDRRERNAQMDFNSKILDRIEELKKMDYSKA